MLKDLTKKAVDMLLKGATLLSEPCPYCKGVRIMLDGDALCVNCGKEPNQAQKTELVKQKMIGVSKPSVIETLEKKLESLSMELESESDHEKQQNILKSINSVIETITKLKN
jgi:UPF0148 protein